MEYYSEAKDYGCAQSECSKENKVLLDVDTYNNLTTCIHKEIKNIKQPGVWLKSESKMEKKPMFNLSGTFECPKDQEHLHFICISQDPVFTTLKLTVERCRVSGFPVFDLLLPQWANNKVFKEVSKGETMILQCDALGNPTPELIFKKDGDEIKNITKNGQSQITVKITADTCGTLGRFTCEDKKMCIRKSISIEVTCDATQLPSVNDQVLITCPTEGMSYENITVIKLLDKQLIPTRKTNNKLVAEDGVVAVINKSCDTMGTYICVVTLNNGTTVNISRNISVDNCSPVLCPGEVTDNIINATTDRYLISFCVIAYPDVSEFLKVNNKKVYRNTDSNFDWNIKESRFYSSYSITIIIKNMIHLTSGDLTIEVCTTQDRCLQLNYTVRTNMVTSSNQKSKNRRHLKVADLAVNHNVPSMNVTITFASLAVIMAGVSIICFVIGVIMRRTTDRRERSEREYEDI